MALEHGGAGRPAAAPPTPALGTILAGTALAARFSRHVVESGLITVGSTVVVAVSGGLDSVALLHLLRFRVPELRLRLAVAHFDHRMRAGSAADADWVAGLCQAWEIPLERGAATDRLRSEADARAARYRFLDAVAGRQAAEHIVTGHHADDQAETVLFRIIRGTGLTGLAGIPARRGIVVRPLLPYRRADLVRYAQSVRLRWREDATNRLLTYSRNRLRHKVLPRLEEIAPGASAALVRLAKEARAAEAGWDSVLARLEAEAVTQADASSIELARPILLWYHPFLRARLLRRLLRRLGSRPDRVGTGLAVEFISSGASGSGIQLSGGVHLEREFDRIRIRRAAVPGAARPAEQPLVIREPASGEGTVAIGGRTVRLRWRCEAGDAPYELPAEARAEAFDPEALRFPLVIRAWRAGDRIRVAAGTKKLKKLFGERRIGRAQRDRVLILADAEGRVLWASGVARASVAEPKPGRPVFRVVEANASVD